MVKGDGRGGFRPGAGRKPVLRRPKRLSLVLEEETHEELARLANDERVAPSVYIRRILERHIRARGRPSSRPPPGGGPGGSHGD